MDKEGKRLIVATPRDKTLDPSSTMAKGKNL